MKKIESKTLRLKVSEDQTSTLLPTVNTRLVDLDLDLDIAPSSVHILQSLGNARFGTVYIGNVVTSRVASKPVIIKTLASGADPLTKQFFIGRTRAMAGLKHCNVLGLVGACLQQTGQSAIISALYEHYDGVDLNTFLHRHTTMSMRLSWSRHQTDVLMKLAVDCVCGLTYLSHLSIIHGHVASNNVLVVTDAADVTGKVCDLGLTSPWTSCTSQHQCVNCLSTLDSAVAAVWPHSPIAPELLLYGHVAITEATDVWQFGVLLSEIYYVTRHQHLVAIVTDCCSDEPAHRPRFEDIHHRLLAASVTFDPVIDPANRVTGEVSWGCDLHTSSPATSNETGYSLLTVGQGLHAADRPAVGHDGLINELELQQQQPCRCRHDNSEMMMNDARSSSAMSSDVVV